jgi:hypothetical protein
VSRDAGHGFWPYWGPYFSFLLIVSLVAGGEEGRLPFALLLQVGVPLGLLLAFASRGAYPELRGYGHGASGAALDLVVGLAGGALWMAPYVLFPAFRALRELEIPLLQAAPEAAFDPGQLGASLTGVALGLRAVGYGFVTPFVEELFLRSWLARYVDVLDRSGDFRDVPIARYTRISFAAVVVCFLITHVPWEWPVALLWILGTQLWFYHRRHLLSMVLVHAGSNLGIFLAVVLASGRIPGPDGEPLDLWFFL